MMISKEEKKWIAWFAFFILFIATVPYLVGYFNQGEYWRFTGFVYGVEDGNSYIAKMLSGSYGSWLFETPYTAFPQNGFIAFFPYLLLGKLAHAPGLHEQLIVLFQLFRWVAGWLYIYSSYCFISFFIEPIKLRRLGTILASVGGGLGWLTLFGFKTQGYQGLPLEFYSPETFGFLSILGLPHLAAARGFLLLGLLEFFKESKQNGIRTGLFFLALGFMQPMTVLIGFGVIGLYIIVEFVQYRFEKKIDIVTKNPLTTLKQAIVAGAISLPIPIYTAVSFVIDPYLSGWVKQNIILSPPFGDYLLAYGLLIPLGIIGGVQVYKKKPGLQYYTILAWVIIFPVLVYAPYNLQRRLVEGVWTALIILALLGIERLSFVNKSMIPILTGVSTLSSLIIFVGSVFSVTTPSFPLYRSAEEVKVFEFIQSNAAPGDVVLADYDVANGLPAWAPVKTLIGHGPESIQLTEIQDRVNRFYTNNDFSILNDFRIRFVLFEKNRPNRVFENNCNCQMVYTTSNYFLYRINSR